MFWVLEVEKIMSFGKELKDKSDKRYLVLVGLIRDEREKKKEVKMLEKFGVKCKWRVFGVFVEDGDENKKKGCGFEKNDDEVMLGGRCKEEK